MILDKIRSIEFDRNLKHVFGIKSGIVWANPKDGGGTFPLLYISKPKQVPQEDFEAVLDRLSIDIYKEGFLWKLSPYEIAGNSQEHHDDMLEAIKCSIDDKEHINPISMLRSLMLKGYRLIKYI